MDPIVGIIVAVLVLSVVIVLARTVRIVPQQRHDVVERLGKYKRTLSPGLTILVPFIDAVRTKVDMREQVVSFPPQPVITSDNLVVSIDTVLYFKVVDPVRATYEIANFLQAIELRADGDRQARILQADGQAKAISTVFSAIHAANPDAKVMAYQYLQAL